MDSLHVAHDIPIGYEVRYPQYLYNVSGFLTVNNRFPHRFYYLIDHSQQQVLGCVVFTLHEGVAKSPLKAPFGGVITANHVKVSQVRFFVGQVVEDLRKEYVHTIEIHMPPMIYIDQQLCHEVLISEGFEKVRQKVFHAIFIEKEKLDRRMAEMERRRLKKCMDAGFLFKPICTSELERVYQFINKSRMQKGRQLSLSWNGLKPLINLFPDNYLPFGVYDKGKLIAATIAVKVNKKVLYHFYPAHDVSYNHYSPMVMLVSEIYVWCQENGICLLDLGASYVDGVMKEELARFKEHLGGVASEAVSFRKSIPSL